MILFPAIDLLDQHAVRLTRGEYHKATIYNRDPIKVARAFEKQSAQWIHCVDLNAARDTVKDYTSPNHEIIRNLVAEISIPIQLGGGIRTIQQVESWLDAGVQRVILGTAALENWAFLAQCCKLFPGYIALSIDVKDGALWTRGWHTKLDITPLEGVKRGADYGACLAIVTDITRDGTLSGPNWNLASSIANATSIPIVVSGGIGCLADVAAISGYPQISGIILGKALYERRFTLASALAEIESGG